MPEPNARLKFRREKLVLSQAELAEQVGVSEMTVRRWEAGLRPQPAHLRRLCAVLDASPAELGFGPRGSTSPTKSTVDASLEERPAPLIADERDLQAADRTRTEESPSGTDAHDVSRDRAFSPDDEERLAAAAKAPGRRDPGVVHALSAMLAAQRRTEDLLGSVALLGPVTAQLAVIERLVAGARGELQLRLLDVGAQWAQFAGWLHTNAAQPDQATRLYGQALGWAVEVDNADLAAEVISLKGLLAWTMGDMEAVMRLSQAAQRDRRAFPGQHAISAAQEARVHAVYGDAVATDRKLADALDRAALAAERPEDAPPWLYYHSSAFFTLHVGRAYRYLGRNDPERNRRAIEELTRGIRDLPEDQRQTDWTGEYILQLAIAYVQAGDIDQACSLAGEDVAIVRQTGFALAAREGQPIACSARGSSAGLTPPSSSLEGSCDRNDPPAERPHARLKWAWVRWCSAATSTLAAPKPLNASTRSGGDQAPAGDGVPLLHRRAQPTAPTPLITGPEPTPTLRPHPGGDASLPRQEGSGRRAQPPMDNRGSYCHDPSRPTTSGGAGMVQGLIG